MAYDYSCTYCGKRLNQSSVNIQLLPILGETAEKELRQFSFLVTEGEFRKILSQSSPVDGGYVRCKISFNEYMGYLANERNRNDPRIRDLTYEQFELFAEEEYDYKPQVDNDIDEAYEEDDIDSADLFEDDGNMATKQESSDEVDAKKSALQKAEQSKALEKLFLSIFRSAESAETADKKSSTRFLSTLKTEIRFIKNAFDESTIEFDITLRDDLEDDKNNRIFYGYKLRNPRTKKVRIYDQARTCSNPLCRNPVFEYAGTAEHKSIAFIGDQKAGKTSTLIALASYAEKACRGGGKKGDPIWENVKGIPGVVDCRVIGKNERYNIDMERYNHGLGPKKTEFAKGIAYSITLRVRPAEPGKVKLLTLTDLPGELSGLRTGKKTQEDIYNDFPQALSCDAYILCYDASVTESFNSEQNLTDLVLMFQREHLANRQHLPGVVAGSKQYIPLIIIFNKCVELEDPEYDPGEVEHSSNVDRIAATYIFDDERREIFHTPKYRELCIGMRDGNETRYAYQAAIRIAPFGFPAEDKDYKPDNNEDDKYPRPRNIKELLQWLMAVTGCIPCEAKYIPDPSAEEMCYETKDYIVNRLQCRVDLPKGNSATEELDEATIRCYLFSNPGNEDTWMLEHYDNSLAIKLHKLLGRRREN